MEITKIVAHHSGGLGINNQASTRHLTPYQIATHHKNKWNFPSKFITDPVLKYGGYNAIYDVKTCTFHQCRGIGEETAAQRGHNSDTFSLCIIGNYNKSTRSSFSVDPITDIMEQDIAIYLQHLINGNKLGLVVASNTRMNFAVSRTYAHRFFSSTECYGTYLSDNWIRNLLIKNRPVDVYDVDKAVILRERLKLIQLLLKAYSQVADLLRQKRIREQSLGAVDDRECNGFIN